MAFEEQQQEFGGSWAIWKFQSLISNDYCDKNLVLMLMVLYTAEQNDSKWKHKNCTVSWTKSLQWW